MKVQALLLVSMATLAAGARAATVEFHIPAGTGSHSWNTRATMIEVALGDTLRLINDDTIVHALHTDGDVPCPHGTDMAPNGGSYDCVIGDGYDSDADGPLYDHNHTSARFWLFAR